MKTKREQMDNNEYVWKVLLAECFIKFYMDLFGFDKKEAEKRISETPLGRAVEDSEDNSSDEFIQVQEEVEQCWDDLIVKLPSVLMYYILQI